MQHTININGRNYMRADEFIYPIFKQSLTNDEIVMFTGFDTGIPLFSNRLPEEVGNHSTGWAPHTDLYIWKPYQFILN